MRVLPNGTGEIALLEVFVQISSDVCSAKDASMREGALWGSC